MLPSWGGPETPVGADDELARMERERRILRALLDEACRATGHQDGRSLIEALLREKGRSERYNHYFAVVLLSSPTLSTWELLETAAGSFRSTDTVGVVASRGRDHVFSLPREAAEIAASVRPEGQACVGVILPETDRRGA